MSSGRHGAGEETDETEQWDGGANQKHCETLLSLRKIRLTRVYSHFKIYFESHWIKKKMYCVEHV